MKSPKPPSVGGTALAQGAANRDTAITQQLLNMTNQVTPYGSLKYNQSGLAEQQIAILDDKGNPTGKFQTIKTPTFTATTTLTPAQQALLEQEQTFDKRFNDIALDQTDRMGKHLSTPFSLDNNAIEGRIGELARTRLDPMWQQREEQFDQKMANQGIQAGSDAYVNARRSFDIGRNDAYNSMLLDARGQAMNELVTGRNQPINEIAALMGGGQVQQPTFVNTPQTGVSGTDVAGLIAANYGARNNNYQAMLGGLSGLGAAALGGWAMSDRRLKTDVKKVGKLDDGTKIYSYKYKDGMDGGLSRLGLMAQEVEKNYPEAVKETDSGFKAVNYGRMSEALMNNAFERPLPQHWTQVAARLARALLVGSMARTGPERLRSSVYGS
jgi:hypothetical protein